MSKKNTKKPVTPTTTPNPKPKCGCGGCSASAPKQAPQGIDPEMIEKVANEMGNILGILFGGPKEQDRPPRTDLRVINIPIEVMWKNACDALFHALTNEEHEASAERMLKLLSSFGGANGMRAALKDHERAAILLDQHMYNDVADMVNHRDPFVLVVRKGNDVFASVSPIENTH